MRIRYVLSGVAALAALGVSAPVALAALTPTSSNSSASSSPTSANELLISAAKTESAAYQQYYAYAAGADKSGHAGLADVWQTVGQVEHQDHWTHELTLAALYSSSDDIANLQIAITQAQQAATSDEGWASQPPKDSAAARELRTVTARETAAAGLLTQAAQRRAGQGRLSACRPGGQASPGQGLREAVLFRHLLQTT
jgi:rubrerythrin